MTFRQKVQSMSAKQIVQAMIDGLNKPWVTVSMLTYGAVVKDVCFGCAATNTICQIKGSAFNASNIATGKRRSVFLNTPLNFLKIFEYAIDHLKAGNIQQYNIYARTIRIKTLPMPTKKLPTLTTVTYKKHLKHYQKFCNSL